MSLPFCPRGGRRNVPAVRRRRIPPLRFSEKTAARKGRTRQRQFECPAQPVQKKEPPRQGEHACGSSRTPLSRCRKRSRPVRANTPAAVRAPRSAGAEKGAARIGRTRQRRFAHPAQPVQRKEPPRQGEPVSGSSSAPLSRCRIEKNPIFNRKNLRKPAWTDCLSHLYLL